MDHLFYSHHGLAHDMIYAFGVEFCFGVQKSLERVGSVDSGFSVQSSVGADELAKSLFNLAPATSKMPYTADSHKIPT